MTDESIISTVCTTMIMVMTPKTAFNFGTKSKNPSGMVSWTNLFDVNRINQRSSKDYLPHQNHNGGNLLEIDLPQE